MPNNTTLHDELSKLIGLDCCDASLSYPQTIVLGFGKAIKMETLRGQTYIRGEWQIRSYSGAWRVVQGNVILAGWYDYDGDEARDILEEALKMLTGKKLQSISISETSSDTVIKLSDSYSVEFLESSCEDFNFEFSNANNTWEVGPKSHWQVESNDSVSTLTPEERELANHAERCHERWKNRFPSSHPKGECRNCAYYVQLRGHFYLYDYGLCSNVLSMFDGTGVNVKSGCEMFSTELEATNNTDIQ